MNHKKMVCYRCVVLSFFKFSDMLLYTSKGVTATNQFKVHGQLPLHGMIVSIFIFASKVREWIQGC